MEAAAPKPPLAIPPPSLLGGILAVFHERDYIAACPNSVIANDYPKESLELLIIDGMSEDGTREIVLDYARRYQFIRVLDNPKHTTPAALKIGSQPVDWSQVRC